MARFQGNIHEGSDKAAATVLFIILLLIVLLLGWYFLDQAGFMAFWTNLANSTINR